ncbi:hypothetical protein DE146DRAFT_641462 [Phaeosphaeria sp. MPI-PUGE-AT-0046c]|nr:hypothetical protein DE146DRAFT_641462 [Phaeosphaeria sp. MPI-PUGE-AT-0046c]
MTSMTNHISILPATLADIPTLAAIRTEAAESSLLTHFQFSPYHKIAKEKESDTLITRLSKRFTEPDGQKFHLIKAVDTRNGETVGWALVKWEDGSWVNTGATSSAHPDGEVGPTNPESFGQYWSREVIAKWRGITGGKPHVTIGAMNVKITWQGQGIGKMMIEYMYREYGLENDMVIVQTTASAEIFYQKMGWKTVDSTDIDLSDWAGKGLGYGLLRCPQMVRYPQGT